jgi:hypothetical protein
VLFNLEFDHGSVVEGYVVPDGYAEHPGIIVMDGQQRLLEMKCNAMREAVIRSGRHETGMIGFRLDDSIIGGLAERRDLAVFDAKTGILIYRRSTPEPTVAVKLARLETQAVPMLDFDMFMLQRFQYAMERVERFGLETAQQIFHLNAVPSIYVAGRLHIRNFSEFLDRGFHMMMIVTEPYVDMAERIHLCKSYGSFPPDFFGERDRMLMRPIVDHFADVDLASPDHLRRALKYMDEPVRRYLESPMVRMLATLGPEDTLTRNSVATGLDFLSRFSIVGLRSEPDTYAAAVGELVGVPAASVPVARVHPKISALAGLLQTIPLAERIIEYDLIAYHFTAEAVREAQGASP